MSKPRIVCICGSSRFIEEVALKKWELEKQGILAIGMHLLPQGAGVQPHHQAEHEGVDAILDELHLKKIEMSDEVFIMNVGGYIGERTQIEIEYAEEHGKPIIYFEPILASNHTPSIGGIPKTYLKVLKRLVKLKK